MAHTGIGFVYGGFHLTCGLQHGENLQEGDSLSLPRPQISDTRSFVPSSLLG